MKRGLVCLTLFVIALICSVRCIERKRLASTKELATGKPKSVTSAATQGKAAETDKLVKKVKEKAESKKSSLNENSKKTQEKEENLNSLGLKVAADTVLKQFPYSITRCDQIAFVKGHIIPHFEDYAKRESAFFVITAYRISVFKDENADNLIQTNIFSEAIALPTNLRGARGCISIDGGDQMLALCTESQENADNLIEVIKQFQDCRDGSFQINTSANNSITHVKKEKTDRIQAGKLVKSCGIGNFTDEKDLEKKLNQLKKKQEENKKNSLYNPNAFFIPGKEKIPGSP